MPVSSTAPTRVRNIRLNWRASVRSQSGVSPGRLLGRLPQRTPRARVGEVVGAEAELAGTAVDERVGEAADVAGRLPDLRVEDDRGVERDDVLALAHHRLEPARLDVVLQQHAVVAVVVGGAEAAVDLRGGEDEAAPPRQRDDCVHRHGVGGSGSAIRGRLPPGWRHSGDRGARAGGRLVPPAGVRARPGAESYGLEAAEKLGAVAGTRLQDARRRGRRRHVFALLPVDARLDPKAVGKRAHLADPADAERITGYVKGGTSVLGGREAPARPPRRVGARARDDRPQRRPTRAAAGACAGRCSG